MEDSIVPALMEDSIVPPTKLRFKPCTADQCLFIRRNKSHFVILALEVDDIIITASDKNELISKRSFCAKI